MNKTPSHPVRGAIVCAALLIAASLSSPLHAAAAEAKVPESTVALFNGRDLSGWVVVARDNDPAGAQTWSVRDGVLTATGEPYGYARTAGAWRDYALRIEWRWVPGEAPRDPQGRPRGRNSGVLLHTHGEDKVWPSCVEAQLHEGNAGDFIALGPIVFDELTAMREQAAAAAGDDAEARQRALTGRRLARQHASSEKAIGEWNTYEIVARGDTMTLTVNGVLQNTATRLTVSEGWIGLQSEGMPIEFRRVELSPLP